MRPCFYVSARVYSQHNPPPTRRQLEDEKHAGLRKEDMGRLKAAVGSRKAFHVEALGHLAGTPKKQERQADARASPPSGSENDTEDALSSSDMSHSGMRRLQVTPGCWS